MNKIVLALALTLVTGGTALAQSCQHDSDRASDGSRCGHRSSDFRSGGR
ncbi:transmembrane anchored protein [Methylobacterium sp. WL6]|nr:transmembrane anchored protein [Methylobacterium sp. WL6]